ncbi:MAG: hypothetical protein LUI10_09320 [Lachnospiraceae bacterium]|nr:hypothetical protein [Lachnospiraceae bacterium]
MLSSTGIAIVVVVVIGIILVAIAMITGAGATTNCLSYVILMVVVMVISLILVDLLGAWLRDLVDKFLTWLMSFEWMTNFTWE